MPVNSGGFGSSLSPSTTSKINSLVSTARLSPASGIYAPDGSTDYADVNTLYLVSRGNMSVPIWNGTQFLTYEGAELSLDITSNKLVGDRAFTVALEYNNNNPRLIATQWASGTMDATFVEGGTTTYVDGIRLLNGNVVVGGFYVFADLTVPFDFTLNNFSICSELNRETFTANCPVSNHTYSGDWRPMGSLGSSNVRIFSTIPSPFSANGYVSTTERGQIRWEVSRQQFLSLTHLQTESDVSGGNQKPVISTSGLLEIGQQKVSFEEKGNQAGASVTGFGFAFVNFTV